MMGLSRERSMKLSRASFAVGGVGVGWLVGGWRGVLLSLISERKDPACNVQRVDTSRLSQGSPPRISMLAFPKLRFTH